MTEEELIQKGFNHGYELQGLDVKIATLITTINKSQKNAYIEGFKNGVEEKTKENSLIINKSYRKNIYYISRH